MSFREENRAWERNLSVELRMVMRCFLRSLNYVVRAEFQEAIVLTAAARALIEVASMDLAWERRFMEEFQRTFDDA